MPDDLGPLPTLVTVSGEFVRRMPSQRTLDELARVDSAPFGELLTNQPSRVMAFRVLMRDHPHRDPSSLWLHAYDVEVEVSDLVDPTAAPSPTASPQSVPTIT